MTITVGKRVVPNIDGQLLLKEGEYGLGPGGIWYARPPGQHMGSLENHDVTVHDDDTISVSPSILIGNDQTKWHGHLVKGVWEEID